MISLCDLDCWRHAHSHNISQRMLGHALVRFSDVSNLQIRKLLLGSLSPSRPQQRESRAAEAMCATLSA
jgi:hypothetical protein